MEVVRHGGPNWARGCAAVDLSGELLAVSVRSSVVLLRAADGAFVGEVRQLGRGAPRALALAFAHAPGLAHLLAVSYDDGSWRVFDSDTRRLVRSGGGKDGGKADGRQGRRDIAGICFGAETPNLLFVALSDGNVDVYDIAEKPRDGSAQCVLKARTLALGDMVRSPSCVCSVRGAPAVLLVAGEKAGVAGATAGAVVAVDVRTGAVLSSLDHVAGAVDSLSVYSNAGFTYVAFVSAADGKPEGALFREDNQLVLVNAEKPSAGHAKAKAKSQAKAGTAPIVSLSWMPWPKLDECFLVTSLASGALQLWRVGRDAPVLKLRAELAPRDAHARQVFAIVPLRHDASTGSFHFVTASMDRKLVGWVSDGSILSCVWSSVGSGGYVQALAVRKVASDEGALRAWLEIDDSLSNATGGSLVATGCGDGSVAVDYSDDNRLQQPVIRRVLHYRVPKSPGGKVSAVVSVSFLTTGTESACPSEGGAMDYPLYLVFCTEDGQVGCIDVCSAPAGRIPGSDSVVLSRSEGLTTASSRTSGAQQGGWRPPTRGAKLPIFLAAVERDSFLQVTRNDGICRRSVERRGKTLALRKSWDAKTITELNAGDGVTCVASCRSREAGGCLCIGTESGSLVFLFSDRLFKNKSGICETTGDRRLIAKAFADGVTSVSVNDTMEQFAVGSDSGGVAVYRICESGSAYPLLQRQWVLRSVHSRRVTSLAWQPCTANDSGEHLLTCSEDGVGKILTSTSGTSVSLLKGHAGRMLTCAWRSHDFVFTGGEDCSLREWTLAKLPQT